MRCIFQSKEWGEGVRFETFLQVGGCGAVDGRWTEQARRADPDVETAKGVEGFVDEGEGVVFGGDGVGVVDYAGFGVEFGEGGLEAGRGGGGARRRDGGGSAAPLGLIR